VPRDGAPASRSCPQWPCPRRPLPVGRQGRPGRLAAPTVASQPPTSEAGNPLTPRRHHLLKGVLRPFGTEAKQRPHHLVAHVMPQIDQRPSVTLSIGRTSRDRPSLGTNRRFRSGRPERPLPSPLFQLRQHLEQQLGQHHRVKPKQRFDTGCRKVIQVSEVHRMPVSFHSSKVVKQTLSEYLVWFPLTLIL